MIYNELSTAIIEEMQNKEFRLDLIRVTSLLLVIIQHSIDRFIFEFPESPVWSNEWLFIASITLYQIARIAVPMFIMLSGFLLLPQFLDKQNKKENRKPVTTTSFYKRRWNRIGIVSLFAFIGYFIWQSVITGESTSVSTILQQFFFMDTGHLYFLQILVVLYFITPFLARFPWLVVRNTVGGLLAVSAFVTILAFQDKELWQWYRSVLVYPFLFLAYYITGWYMYSRQKTYLTPPQVLLSVLILGGVSSISLYASWISASSPPWYSVSVLSVPHIVLSIIVFMTLLRAPITYASIPGWIGCTIHTLAQWSFLIYIIHPFILDLIRMFMD